MEELRQEYGLDKSLPVQYLEWIWNVTHGDFGMSLFYRDQVGKVILERLPVTLYLGTVAFLLSAILGILVGVVSGVKRGKWIDTVTTVVAYLGVATPSFWLGILLIYVFGLQLNLLPIAGYTSPLTDFSLSIQKAILPVICLSISGFAVTARQVRSSMIEVIQRDYIRTARSKGLKEVDVVFGHALKNSLIPVITVIGMNVRHLISGSVVIESVFAIPGIGRLLVDG
ncbi:ABC transporter permease, partial [Chloroflexota bacterium]